MPSQQTTRKKNTKRASKPRVRLAYLHVENYKSLDSVDLSLPAPSTEDELDAFVLGSKNGIGKSSLLECCAFSMIGAVSPKLLAGDHGLREFPDLFDLLVRTGADKAIIKSSIVFGEGTHPFELELSAKGRFRPNTAEQIFKQTVDPIGLRYGSSDESDVVDSVLGMNSEPLVLPRLLLFHSYRKIREGNSALGAMVDPAFVRRHYPPRRLGGPGPLSTFKVVLVQALMAKSGLFERVKTPHNEDEVIKQLNGLLRDFAGGIVDKLRPGPDGSLELRVTPSTGGQSFGFDGLSSGQKEIIATLFLIWFMTLDRPSVVLVDEPELHLNAEWQRLFVYKLAELAPRNQYILATHSEEIFGSVAESRRIMLRRE